MSEVRSESERHQQVESVEVILAQLRDAQARIVSIYPSLVEYAQRDISLGLARHHLQSAIHLLRDADAILDDEQDKMRRKGIEF